MDYSLAINTACCCAKHALPSAGHFAPQWPTSMDEDLEKVTPSRKFALYFACSGLFLICIVASYAAQQAYQASLDGLLNNVRSRTENRTDLQLYFLRQDKAGLRQILSEYIKPDAIQSAAALSNIGEILATRTQHQTNSEDVVSLRAIRGESADADSSLAGFDRNQQPSGTGFWSSITTQNLVIHFVTTVL